MNKRHHLIVEGKVQGVGFRYFTQEQAQHYGLAGWVRNLPDGTVELEAEGDDQQFDAFLEAIKTKNRFAKVEHIQHQIRDARNEEEGFTVKH
ncbi:acylphosphatase [Alkalicoccobacillus porphyridii]|uniref:Acylphosphatase n=1 Tax=Alkalicoccobacillus porphyridii TaxID=2597270 RepID=A0A553ZUK4_9BACI|nr:acylphosphatase [Alkalicoccobacillus porphyridii]TSB45137.1 acylphosphatase [Alkalicoccobacillus porphyridii]